ncbi:MAG: YfiR family protein [Pseudomonadota bacterium]
MKTNQSSKMPIPRATPLGLALVLAIISHTLITQNRLPLTREHQLKAAFLFDFTKFIKWPCESNCNSDSALNFCLIGLSPLTMTLEQIVNYKTVRGRKAAIRSIQDKSQLEGCHVLYIPQSKRQELSGILDAASGNNILTVSDIKHFTRYGGMIEFLVIDNKLRFSINLRAAKRENLVFSSQLLKLAITLSE